jgi:hypothetical protein
MTWPDAELDAIRRLRVLASAYPSAGCAEVTLSVPFDDAWPWLMDLERNVPRWDTLVRRLRLRRLPEGEFHMWVWVRWWPIPWPFRVRIEPGFCIMQGRGRAFLVLMAAVPDGHGKTRYAHAEAVPLRRLRFLRRQFQRMVDADLAQLRVAIQDRS